MATTQRRLAGWASVWACLFLFGGVTPAGAQSCDVRPPPTPPSNPGWDSPDDNVSAATATGGAAGPDAAALTASHLVYVRVNTDILASGSWANAQTLLDGLGIESIVSGSAAVSLGADPRPAVLLIPSGGLAEFSRSAEAGSSLAQYVTRGGTLVVFSQQHGSDFSVLPTPDGRPLHGWGWHEDNSCYTSAAYIESFHPILASQSWALVSSNIDGYFDSIPDNAIVLLRRVKNGLPAMFMYPYGQGWVIVSSSYDDWGGYNQSGAGARAIVRDAIAWAKKPADLPIHLPGSAVSINLQVKNVTDLAASQVKLILMSPSRDRVLSEQTLALTVGAGETVQAAFSHTFPADAELGIYHVDYELLDGAGETIQPITEEDTGRLVVAKPPAPGQYRPSDLSFSILMPEGEDSLRGEPTVFRYRLANRSFSARRFRVYWEFQHGPGTLAREVLMGPNESFEDDITLTTPARYGQNSFFMHVFEEGGIPRPRYALVDVAGETWAYQLTDGKGFRNRLPEGEVSATTDRAAYVPGETATFDITARNKLARPWSGSVRVGDNWGTIVAEQSVSLPASGSVVLTPGGSTRRRLEWRHGRKRGEPCSWRDREQGS